MRNLFHILLAVLLITVFAAEVYAQDKPKEAVKGKPEVKVITTIIGKVRAVDAEGKTITVGARYEMDFYVHENTVLTQEFVAGKKIVKFDASKAKLGACAGDKCTGIADLKKGDHVRVAYDKAGGAYIAHTILRIRNR